MLSFIFEWPEAYLIGDLMAPMDYHGPDFVRYTYEPAYGITWSKGRCEVRVLASVESVVSYGFEGDVCSW